jgi:hypothetical protein
MPLVLAGLCGAASVLCGCADTHRMNNDIAEADTFGHAVREDLVAQIVNPTPAWKGPLPPVNGNRAALGQNKYLSDTVTQPVSLATSTVAGSGGP